MSKYYMYYRGGHGIVDVPETIFNKLDPKFFISKSSETVKYMCANIAETKHLQSLGIQPIFSDWYKINLI